MGDIIRELINRRNFVKELVLKDIRIRYRRPVLGFLWAFLTPLAMAVIFYIVFGICLKVKIEEAPFPLYLMSALFTWRLFQDSLCVAVTCLYDNKTLLRESKIPAYLFPVAIVLLNTVTALPGFALVIALSAVRLHGVSIYIFLLPLILIIHAGITAAFSIIAAILYIRWRDIRYASEIGLTILFYATPVFYSVGLAKELLPAYAYRLYIYNPFVCILTLYRVSFIKGYTVFVGAEMIFKSLIVVVLFAGVFLAIAGMLYKANKRYINEHISY
jgi:ABC-type polysaccharide/polyol phosphate export permease